MASADALVIPDGEQLVPIDEINRYELWSTVALLFAEEGPAIAANLPGPVAVSDDIDSVVRAIDLVSARLILLSVPLILWAGLATRGGHRSGYRAASRILAPSGSDPQLNIL